MVGKTENPTQFQGMTWVGEKKEGTSDKSWVVDSITNAKERLL